MDHLVGSDGMAYVQEGWAMTHGFSTNLGDRCSAFKQTGGHLPYHTGACEASEQQHVALRQAPGGRCLLVCLRASKVLFVFRWGCLP